MKRIEHTSDVGHPPNEMSETVDWAKAILLLVAESSRLPDTLPLHLEFQGRQELNMSEVSYAADMADLHVGRCNDLLKIVAILRSRAHGAADGDILGCHPGSDIAKFLAALDRIDTQTNILFDEIMQQKAALQYVNETSRRRRTCCRESPGYLLTRRLLQIFEPGLLNLVRLDTRLNKAADHLRAFLNSQASDLFRKPGTASIEQLDSAGHKEFEKICARLLERDGLQVVQAHGKKGDLAADVIGTDRYGQRFVLQCKHFSRVADKVGSETVQKVNGTARPIHNASTTMIVTNGGFTSDARRLADAFKIHLIGRAQLKRWAVAGDDLSQIMTRDQLS
ncbi:restriction endonuclease [Streptomyces luomodiensis]|uniref:Restriction endonuclease n=1 Tax=Streptomyces luomodiensis TaxID=3026192 RepID=A0ABY9V864_9ACTN|nr:restriction endonuclease [Streptomyces sp. SCA4-21]WNE98890.1 restriction endonuclease [Streptomyces sp. SCA4-21]